ncbi:hypothetical protein Bbelb_359160 [Branchiostoma belcheri]|nr:hypothetical protein Bbelb_359160 [Branchiostoma belcheri]
MAVVPSGGFLETSYLDTSRGLITSAGSPGGGCLMLKDSKHPMIPVWDGEWHTVCTTWRSSDGAWQLYADGVLTDSGSGFNVGGRVRTGGTWILGQDQDVVGGRFDAHQSFIGELSEVNLWDRVLSPAEIAADCSYHGNVIDWDTTNITVFGQASRAEYQCVERPRSSMVSSVTEQIETSTSQGSPACPKDYQLFQGICYKAFNFAADFYQSISWCVKDGGTLAMPRDQKTNEFLVRLKNWVDRRKPFRFGLHDIPEENVWRWMDGQELGDFTDWAPEEPNNSGSGEDCVEYWPQTKKRTTNKWNDVSCFYKEKFICQVDTTEPQGYIPYTDVYFKVFAQLKTYEAAKQTCLSNGGHLADVKTQELHDFLLSEIQKVDGSRDYWIGLNDLKVEKTWTWSDGTPVSECVFTNWAPGQPNNYGQGQDCAHLWKGKGFKWDDDGCGKQKYFICQIGFGDESSCRRSEGKPTDVGMQSTLELFYTADCPEDYQLFQGICYKAFNFAADFQQSVIRCVKDGGTLAMPRDKKTNEFLVGLKKLVDQKSPFRFGLHDILDENVWRWMDGQELGDFTDWGPGEPNDAKRGPGEDCVEYLPYHKDKWNDVACQEKRKFICQVDTSESVLVSGSIDAGVRYEGRAVLESPVFSTNCSNSTLVFHYEMQGSTVAPTATLYVSIVDNESNSDSELLGTIPFKLTHGQTNRVQMDFHRKQPFRVVFTAELDHSANSTGRVGQIHLFDVMVVNGKACRPAGPILSNSEGPVPSKEPALSEGPAVSKGAIIGTIVGLVIVAVAIAAGVTVARRMKGERFRTAATSTTVLMNLENVMFEPSMDDED